MVHYEGYFYQKRKGHLFHTSNVSYSRKQSNAADVQAELDRLYISVLSCILIHGH